MDKSYNPETTEEKWYQYWEEQGSFKSNPNSKKKKFSLLMPPPNLTGSPHLGHAMQHSILDAIARFKRMQGFDVLLMPGVDHAGIQFEGTLDRILSKEGLSKHKLGREKWLERAWQFKDECYKSAHDTWKVFGISADWEKETFTLETKVQRAVVEEFKTFWDQDLLYKGAYVVYWCPKCGTAIEDVETEYEERHDTLCYVKYQVQNTIDQFISVVTVRPETIYADVAIALHPNHKLYKNYVGMNVINPLTGKTMRVIEDERVDKDFGTGALKITPGHDLLDYEIGKTHNLPILQAIDKQGLMTQVAGEFAGQKVDKVREQVFGKLEAEDRGGYWDNENKKSVFKAKPYTHSVPVCERCKTIVEPLISEEWFVKMKPLAEKALKNIDKIKFHPDNFKEIISNWLENIHDWSISRSLWWGHRIPVWYCQKCNPNHLVGKDKDMVISLEEPGKTCQTCGEKHWVQDDQVLDTWFSSGLWPMATLGWPYNSGEWSEMNPYFPYSFELSGGEIKYLWIARMIMLSLWFTDKIPFENMFFHGTIRDLQGRKFSKSLGNGIDPNELRLQWGTDATRMALYTYSAPGRDGRASRQTMDERAKNFRNFATKIYNIAKFVIDLKPDNYSKTKVVLGDKADHKDDAWILDELNKTINKVTGYIDNFELHLASEEIYNFVWHTFADIYIEKSKSRREQAQPTLELVLKTSLELLHPFMPFITEEIWQKLDHEEKSISITSWPQRFPTARS